ncbi:MAG: primosomal protein N' [Betaproteobacteria bacterium]|nr:primosomal protein N' [Betaproteobacteria bacterium]
MIRVALDVPLEKTFDFLAPGASTADIGRLVVVPFGTRKMTGVIIDLPEASEVDAGKLKAILHVQRALPAFSAEELELFLFCQRYYHHPFGPIALNAIPPAMRASKPVQPKRAQILTITPSGIAALPTLPARAVAQRAMLNALMQGPATAAALKSRHERAANTLALLRGKGWVIEADAAQQSVPSSGSSPSFIAGPALNADQANAVDSITSALGKFAPLLMSGITGSGKTEVYLNAVAATLRAGRQALILIPEINLTPQFVRQLALRFPDAEIVEQHSGMAEISRMNAYLHAQSGMADIVVGTRLAVFTPLPRLGLIVVDEEHDASFKQQEGFRYSARDVAVFRARQAECPVVLGSATPSLESIHNVARGRFAELKLTERATPGALLPRVEFIDLNAARTEDGLSLALIAAIDETVKRGEQALVFINRRGYAPALVCGQCGWIPACSRCSARLVFHQKERRLKCHHCGYQTKVAAKCVECGSHELIPAGQGTERVESALRARLPAVRIARVDRDSTRRRGAAEKIFDAAASGEIDVLVGTQMLSKGHDFSRITLVGVVNADGAMFSADFRAAERMVAQLMQVSGRAGRAGLPGRVLIQTRFASHPLYAAVAVQDHARFAVMALNERQQAHLPPFTFLALLRAEAKSLPVLEQFMTAAADEARALHPEAGIQVWDPIPATLARKAGFERQQLMVQADSRPAMQQFLAAWLPVVRRHETRAVKWSIDVDPQDV